MSVLAKQAQAALAIAEGDMQVAAGGNHSLAVLDTGELFAWGANTSGQLGVGSTDEHLFPDKVFDSVLSVAAGWHHSIAVLKTGECWAWGCNRHGQIGNEETTDQLSPVQLLQDEWATQAWAGAEQSMVICRKNGSGASVLWAWGNNVTPGWGESTPTGMDLTSPGGQTLHPVRILEHVRTCAAGGSHALAIMEDGRLMAWGRNQHGQLGNGTLTTHWAPQHVSDGMRAVAAGADFSLALSESGELWAWGHNRSGCLGDGTQLERVRPVKVLTGVRAVSASQDFCLALMEGSAGELRGWGSNASGVLGPSRPSVQTVPVKLFEGVKSMSAGGRHAAAMLLNGSCLLWGRNQNGQFGNGTASKRAASIKDKLAASIFPGAHILEDLRAIAERLAMKNQVIRSIGRAPAASLELSRGAQKLGAAYHEDGRVLREERVFKTIYNKGGTIRMVAERPPKKMAPVKHHVPPDEDGDSWRANSDLAVYGGASCNTEALGQNLSPSHILEGVVEIAAGGGHSLATLKGGECAAFGWNSNGQLGDGSKQKQWSPVCVMEQVRSVSAGWYHSLAVTTSSDCVAWGRNNRGQLGLGVLDPPPESLLPVRVLAQVKSVAAGVDHSLALLETGIVVAWGCNSNGQIGNRTMADAWAPVRVLDDARSVAAGRCHSHAVHRLGTCFSWGRNSHGQLGDSSQQMRLNPVQVPGLHDVHHMSAGIDHCLAVLDSGLCCAWGYNGNGRLGDGTTKMRDAPIGVLQGVRQASAGQYHSMAVLENGDCYGWGYNGNGQLGDGTLERRLKPVKVSEGIARVAAGGAHSLAVLRSGSCFAWGWNSAGQLGASRPQTTTTALDASRPPTGLDFKDDQEVEILSNGTDT